MTAPIPVGSICALCSNTGGLERFVHGDGWTWKPAKDGKPCPACQLKTVKEERDRLAQEIEGFRRIFLTSKSALRVAELVTERDLARASLKEQKQIAEMETARAEILESRHGPFVETHIAQRQVEEFHRLVNAFIALRPGIPPPEVTLLRLSLLREEVKELIDALEAGDLEKIADGICDVLYVVYGTAISYGLRVKSLFDEVHRSNMTKEAGPTGKATRGSNYSPPNLWPIIEMQLVDATWEAKQ